MFAVALEVEAPSMTAFFCGGMVLIIGVVLPLAYMLMRNKNSFHKTHYR